MEQKDNLENQKSELNLKSLATAQSNQMPSYLLGKFTQTINLTSDRLDKGKKINPEFKFGTSYEAPTYLQTSNALLCKSSYNNPYILKPVQTKQEREEQRKIIQQNVRKNRGMFFSNQQTYSIQEGCNATKNLGDIFNIHKTDQSPLYNILTHEKKSPKIPDLVINERAQASELHQQILSDSNTFKRKREYFGDFVEKNDQMNVYGQINGKERMKEFKIVKDYSLSPEEVEKNKILRKMTTKEYKSTNLSNTLYSKLDSIDLTQNEKSITNQGSFRGKKQQLLVSQPRNQDILLAQQGIMSNQNSKDIYINESDAVTEKKNFFTKQIKPQMPSIKRLQKSNSEAYLQKMQNIIKCPPIKTSFDKYLMQDVDYMNGLNNSIIRNKMCNQLSTQIFKMKNLYQAAKPKKEYEDLNEGINGIKEFEKLLDKQKTEMAQLNQGGVWFKNFSSLYQKNKDD